MTRIQQISDNPQYSGQLILVYITFSRGSQKGLLILFIKLIVLFLTLYFCKVTLQYF